MSELTNINQQFRDLAEEAVLPLQKSYMQTSYLSLNAENFKASQLRKSCVKKDPTRLTAHSAFGPWHGDTINGGVNARSHIVVLLARLAHQSVVHSPQKALGGGSSSLISRSAASPSHSRSSF